LIEGIFESRPPSFSTCKPSQTQKPRTPSQCPPSEIRNASRDANAETVVESKKGAPRSRKVAKRRPLEKNTTPSKRIAEHPRGRLSKSAGY
jgi:hypothetical protein